MPDFHLCQKPGLLLIGVNNTVGIMRDTGSFQDIHEQDRQRSELLGMQQCAGQVKISGLLYDVVMASEREVKFIPRTDHEGPEGQYRNNLLFFLTPMLDGVSGQGHAPAALSRE